ncbi:MULTISPECIES: nitrate- and nitrite sensing domain-containing protein [unclassified Pseudonocardia]|uniref:sensor histidine kinase n=1 Tax=unclassified Pseudonocardia TaxID=2619320 RepID=UPI00094B6964|nr:nitrate- and nitrite sensing domain-containing protein [Pseudonocardia sp. Ae707_Ps1]OLM21060.1 putative sensor-like histidine kinase [Pseudonocardia sp. Ae707_Ps1]
MTTVTSAERPSTLSERLDPRNWSLVAKLAVVGLVPTVLALSIGAIRVVDQANVAEELGRGSGLVDVHRQIETLTGALQAERDTAVTFLAGNRLGDRAAVDSAQAATDDALRTTTDQLDAAEEQAPQLATARRQAETTLGQLPVIRSQVADGPTPATDVSTRYTSVVQRTLGLDRALVGRLQTAETAGLTTALGSGADAREAVELERTVINGAIAGGQLDEAQRAQVTGAEAAFQSAAGDFASSLTPEQTETFGDFAADPANAERNALRDQALAAPPGAALPIDPAAWNAAVDRSAQAVDRSTQAAEQAFVDGRAAAAEEAGNTAGLNSVLLMLTLLLTGGIILLLGRQMVRSLRLLRSSALEVAERRLPAAVQSMRAGQAPNALVEPVPLDSRDEIGEVARAFDAVHGQAIRLAADQAALQQNVNSMFVNLSRRSQALVERQLQLIEQLESNEQDPDQLSNLFQLDHLATRMRRNSENLLVLAGTDLAKRNVAPVQVVDVLRAAVSEVEQYQRVVVQTPPNATIAGRAANDLVHLLAELLDNATNFSPPDSQVVMSTTRTADESLLVEISDRGVGMTDSELVDANQRLSGPAEVDVSASRRMGLFVVGRLAARHRVGIRLSGTAGGGSGGLSASVTVPPHLVPSAQLPEQRRDGGPAGPERGAPPLPPEPQAPALPEPPAGPSGDAPAPAVAINGSGRGGSLPSMVAGSDGPLTPTFETGAAVSGGARNGSSSALPTRKPGSSLRRNAPSEEAPDGQGTAANGSAPGGLQAFAPSHDAAGREERSPSDVFTPATETGAGTTPEPGPAPGAGGPPRGPDAFRGGRGPAGREPGDDTTGELSGDGDGDAGDDDRAHPGAGTAAALGIAGAAAAGAAARSGTGDGRQGPPAERDLDDTVVMDAATGDGPPPAADRTGTADDDPGDDGTEGPGTSAPEADATEPEADDDAPLGADAALAAGAADAATGTTGPLPSGTGPAGATGADPSGTDTDPADSDGGTATGVTGAAAVAGAVAAGAAVSGAGTADPDGPDTADDAEDPARGSGAAEALSAPDTATDDTGDDDATADDRASDDAATGSPATGDRTTGAGATEDGAEDGPDGGDTAEEDTSTAAIPTVRPAGREPMGGPPASRTNGAGPGAGGRPVMPGGRGPGGAPSPLPTRRPAPGPQGPALPQRAQGQGTAGTPATGAPATAPGGANGAPQPGAAPALPKRQVPARDATAGPAQPGATGGGQEELFAPKVPVEGDRGQLRRPGAVESARGHGDEFDMGQTTPIFDDIASAWFRSNRSVPVRWQDGTPAQAGGPAAQSGRATAAPAEQLTADPAEAGPDQGFASPADDAWRQAREVGDGDEGDRPDDLTTAGLPKRRPRARLLPGSAAGSTVLSPPPAGEPRDAESVRGRLASYQQGVRQGRESASGARRTTSTDGTPEPSGDRPNPSDPEENQ